MSTVFSTDVTIGDLLSMARLVKSVRTSVTSTPGGGLMVMLIGSVGVYQPLLGTSTETRTMKWTAGFIIHVSCTSLLPPTHTLRDAG